VNFVEWKKIVNLKERKITSLATQLPKNSISYQIWKFVKLKGRKIAKTSMVANIKGFAVYLGGYLLLLG
jgi:hypothetical protein